MKRISLIILAICLLSFSFTSCTSKDSSSGNIKPEQSFYKSGSDDSNYVELHKIKDNIWVHTTYTNYEGSRTPSNGVIAVTSKGLILIDTPWNNEQTKELMELTKSVFNKDICLVVITHAHEDRIGGIDTLLDKKIDVRSTEMTQKEAEKNGFKEPQTKLGSEEKVSIGDMNIEVFYPGEGHTADNITVWFPQYKVLFGGCLVKSMDSKSIGNTKDANVAQWPDSLKKVQNKYQDAETVIPGHGQWGDTQLIEHTLELFGK